MLWILGAMFGANFIQNMVTSTGAFEVYFNNKMIFSKLLNNRWPTV